MPIETWLILILGFMIAGSIAALEIRDILSAIIAVGIVGLGVSVAFLFLQAPDLAIVQFLFEIFALIILVRAFVGKEPHGEESSGINRLMSGVTILVLAALFYLSLPVFRQLPVFGDPVMKTAKHYIAEGAAETGAVNLVASVILDYRAYDTLGEITVLFTAILGAFTVLRLRKAKGAEGGGES